VEDQGQDGVVGSGSEGDDAVVRRLWQFLQAEGPPFLFFALINPACLNLLDFVFTVNAAGLTLLDSCLHN
jgi:hypothetical protein